MFNKSIILCVVSLLLPFSAYGQSRQSNFIPSPAGKSAKDLPIKLRQTSINALLILEITKNNFGASVSKLTASALPGDNTAEPMKTKLNQTVGSSMIKSFTEVNQAIFLKYGGWPQGENLTIGFADKHGGKDGPSAAVAYSLLLESIISGEAIRPDLACTGDMNSDRSVQPIGGVVDKIRAAKKAGCKYVLIPEKNVPTVMDAAIDGEIEFLTSIQVISVSNLTDAIKVAIKDSDETTTTALDAYEDVQQMIDRKGISILKSQSAFNKLVVTGKSMKNHQSAKIAAYYKSNRLPKKYSVNGSFARINKAVQPFLEKNHSRGSVERHARNDEHQEAISNISKIKSKVHPKMTKYADRVRAFIIAHRKIMAEKNGVRESSYIYKEFDKSLKELRLEEKKMLEDPEVKDSLAQ